MERNKQKQSEEQTLAQAALPGFRVENPADQMVHGSSDYDTLRRTKGGNDRSAGVAARKAGVRVRYVGRGE